MTTNKLINIYIIGGGVAGMTAAHELSKKKIDGKPVFNITVFEKDPKYIGGKARSIEHKENNFQESDRHNFLPAEHGFRFFPGFYSNIDQVLKEIPADNPGNKKNKSVFDNLVQTSTYMFSFFKNQNRNPILLLNKTEQWDYFGSVLKMIRSTRDAYLDINHNGKNHFAYALFKMITSSHFRKQEEFERESWFDFINARNTSYGNDYATFFADGLTRSLAAAKSRKTSTRTGSTILPKMLFEVIAPGGAAGRVLNAPTNQAWLLPWKNQLEKEGVKFEMNAVCVDIECTYHQELPTVDLEKSALSKNKSEDFYYIESIRIKQDETYTWKHNADMKAIFLFAIPVEKMAKLLTDSRDADIFHADPSLKFIQHLKGSVDWMCGIVFYLRNKVEITHGHINLINSKWAITGIHQEQFWTAAYQPEKFGNGDVKGILSLIMSNCDEDSDLCDKRSVFEMTREDIIKEAWEQIKAATFIVERDDNGEICGYRCPTDHDIIYEYTFLDESVTERRSEALQEINDYLELTETNRHSEFDTAYADYKKVRNDGADNPLNLHRGKPKKKVFVCDNESKLLVNYVNMYSNRPSTYTRIPNMFLAGDYVRTEVDLATMEGACESGIRAANAIVQTVKGSDLYNDSGEYDKLQLSKIAKYINPFYKFLKTPLFIIFFSLFLIAGFATLLLIFEYIAKHNIFPHFQKLPILKDAMTTGTPLHKLLCKASLVLRYVSAAFVLTILFKHLQTKPEKKILIFSIVSAVFSLLCISYFYSLFFIVIFLIIIIYFSGYLFFRSHIRMDEKNYSKGMLWVPFSDGSLVKKLVFYLFRNSGKAK